MQESEFRYSWPQPQVPYPQQYHPTSPTSSNPSVAPSPWSFQNSQLPPTYESYSTSPLSNPWGVFPEAPPDDPDASRQRTQSLRERIQPPMPLRPHRDHGSHAGHAHAPFPQPDAITRSTSATASLQLPNEPRLRTKSDIGQKALPPIPPITSAPVVAATALQRNPSVALTTPMSPFYPSKPEHYYDVPTPVKEVDHEVAKVTTRLSHVALDTEEGLLRFQRKELNKDDEAWHRLVPAAALEALGEKEVQRQSVIFEVLQSERDYVADLEAVSTVIIRPIVQSSEDPSKPTIIPPEQIDDFIHCVFGNFAEILGFHHVMLGYLFARQREQHPLIQSIADIILDVVVREDFRAAYEAYIKHYLVAESKHKQELEHNPAYKEFLNSALSHPQMDKRDLFTLLFRPVTRLPRMNLLLEQILKKTQKEYEHPDLETLPIILGILEKLLKSTQPGVEVAKNKVKLWDLRDNILYQKGEIIDMDLNDEHRSLVFTGPVCRKLRSDATAFSTEWADLTLTLLDNYLVFVREDKRPDGKPRRYLASRPLPVIYVRLGSFEGAVENRKERTEDGGLFDRYRDVPAYPFVIIHAASRSLRRYTLYVTKEEQRKEWETVLLDTVGLARAKQDANLWFNPLPITKRSIKLSTAGSSSHGRITTAVPFSIGGRDYVAIGCQGGVYVSIRGGEKYYKVFNLPNPTEIVAVQTIGRQVHNKLLIQYDNQVISFSLEVVAKFWQKQADNKALTATSERVAGQESSVLLFRHIQIGKKPLLFYTTKRTFSVSPTLHVLEVLDSSKHASGRVSKSFRQYAEPGYVPKDVFNIVALSKNIGVCTKDGIVVIDPLDITGSVITVVPNFDRAKASVETALLKERMKESKPLGLVKLPNGELLVVFDTIGCYISKHGELVRKSRYVRWEATAQSYAHRGEHVLLFSMEFIEIRHADSGRLVQAIQGTDIRLLWEGPVQNKRRLGTIDNAAAEFGGGEEPEGEDERILVAMRDKEGVYDRVIELVETKPLSVLRREQSELEYPYPYPFQQEIMFGGPAVGERSQMPMVMPTPSPGSRSAQSYSTPLSPITPHDNGVPAMWEEWDM